MQEGLAVGNDIAERVSSFKYLGCLITVNWDNMQEVKCGIEHASH